jgi:dienelactone hydrolase
MIDGLDSLEYSLMRYGGNTPRLGFIARTLAEARAWQTRLRRWLIRLQGGFLRRKCDLSPQVIDRREMDGYSRETIAFWSRPGLRVIGYFLLPARFRAPGPALLCLHGHGGGVDDIVGIEENGSQRAEPSGYQMDFAVQAVARGYAVLAIEQLGFGGRRDQRARTAGPRASSCSPAAGAALMLGESMIGWRTYDAVRAVDYLLTRAEVDASRIGVVGISGGGTTALHAAAVDTRIALAYVSGYFSTYRDTLFSAPNCICDYIPGILRYAEMHDIAGLIAPRPFFAESGDADRLAPVPATREAFARLREIYGVFGARDHVALHIFRGGHRFNGTRGWRFVKRHL